MLLSLPMYALTTVACAEQPFLADGFFAIKNENFKVGENNAFVYCDRTDYEKKECYDVLFEGIGGEHEETVLSKWRTSEEYVKYIVGENAEFAGISAPNSSLGFYMFYKIED